ncbi:sensor histidine kinase [Pseudoflavitalea rhizosphaerae]|uniref:sensor histidine kinase n=1 Tax=Pseudoflavitalea rhizosphaerae TaxID=1884793 RepID=UPI000F8CFCF8|nr:ATP-binding protein [Pseudoflavitalea rhizosphaerae]
MRQVIEFFEKLLDTSDWPPRWHCGNWTDFHGWLFIISDLLVWSAYFAIPLIIIRYISRRQDARFFRLYFFFAGFILACGATHLIDAVTFWFPVYRLNALFRFCTGVFSWITVIYLLKLLPQAFALKTNSQLEAEVDQRKKAEEKFRNLLEAAPDSMVIMDESGTIQLVNAQTEKMFGYKREQMITNKVEMLMISRFERLLHIGSELSAGTNKPGPMVERVECFGKRVDGTEFPIEISLSPMKSEEGLLLTAAIRDLSEKKRLEMEVREAHSSLERKVKQRTAELEVKNRELETFAYVASHDLQEPLRTTTSFVDLLRKRYYGQLDNNADQVLDYISQSSDRMKVLIHNLLDYSRLGKEKELVTLCCNELLQDVLHDLDQSIRETNASIQSEPLPQITGYKTEMKQLFQNLVSNSIKFRKNNSDPVITVKAEKDNGSWTFSFKDNGIGINTAFHEKIFVLFKRLHKRSDYEGTGIGLAYCKKIVELHGGKIWVESVPDEGCTFFFTISETQRL